MTLTAKTVKNIIVISGLIIALILTSVQSSAAAGSIVLKASSQQGKTGEKVTITVTAENATGTEGGQFIMTFDSARVRPVSIEPGSLVKNARSNLHMANLEYAPGQLMFMWVTAAGDTADSGEICRVVFELLAEGQSSLGFTEIIAAPDGITAGQPVSGKITVASSGGSSGSPARPEEPATPEEENNEAEAPADEPEEEPTEGNEDEPEPVQDEEEDVPTDEETEPVEEEAAYPVWPAVTVAGATVALTIVALVIRRRNKGPLNKDGD